MQTHIAFWKWLEDLEEATPYQREFARHTGPKGGDEVTKFLVSKGGHQVRQLWIELPKREALMQAAPDHEIESRDKPKKGIGYIGIVDGRQLRYAHSNDDDDTTERRPTLASSSSSSEATSLPTSLQDHIDRDHIDQDHIDQAPVYNRTSTVPSHVQGADNMEMEILIERLPRTRRQFLKSTIAATIGRLPDSHLPGAHKQFTLHTNLMIAALRDGGFDEDAVVTAVKGVSPLLFFDIG